MTYAVPSITSIAQGNHKLAALLKSKINHKAKPKKSLGLLEDLSLQLALIQRSDVISLQRPQLVVFAADHGVVDAGICPDQPNETASRLTAILRGNAAVNVFARQHGFELHVVDAGIKDDWPDHDALIRRKIAHGTVSFSLASAMSALQCDRALVAGAELVQTLPGNVIAFGELGLGNWASASMILSKLGWVTIAEATDPGANHPDPSLQTLRVVLLDASLKFRNVTAPLEVLKHFGGFELAMMVGGMLQAAQEQRIIVVDGFASGAAALVAKSLAPAVVDYMVFSHQADDARHRHLLKALGGKPLMHLDLSIDEGVGALLAWPMVQSAAKFLNEMGSQGSSATKPDAVA